MADSNDVGIKCEMSIAYLKFEVLCDVKSL